MHLPMEWALRVLAWGALSLGGLVFALALLGTWRQHRQDRQNRHRIARYQVWEEALARHLFGGLTGPQPFPPIAREDQRLFQKFLARYQATLAGQEAEALRELYLGMEVHEDLPRRLRHRSARVRAQAVQEVGLFRLTEPLDLLVPLLRDPEAFVAHLAAQSLARVGGLAYAPAVLGWVRQEERYQRDRLLRVLEAFGPDLLPWLETHLAPPEADPEPWVLFALLAASHRHSGSEPRLLAMIQVPQVDLQVSALKALAALADPLTYARVALLTQHETWPIRAQAAKALGQIAGPEAIPTLLDLTQDPVYEVRRNAAQGLADMGHAGLSALAWLMEDPTADRFARDIARERLEWADERGHL